MIRHRAPCTSARTNECLRWWNYLLETAVVRDNGLQADLIKLAGANVYRATCNTSLDAVRSSWR